MSFSSLIIHSPQLDGPDTCIQIHIILLLYKNLCVEIKNKNKNKILLRIKRQKEWIMDETEGSTLVHVS